MRARCQDYSVIAGGEKALRPRAHQAAAVPARRVPPDAVALRARQPKPSSRARFHLRLGSQDEPVAY